MADSERSALSVLRSATRERALVLGGLVGPMWMSEAIDFVLGGALDRFGVRPRSLEGLTGIAFAPFLHADFSHLMANTVPILVLGFIVMLRRKRDLALVSLVSALVAGIGTWLIGASNSTHLGASSLVFGYLGYLLMRGWYERTIGAIAWAVVVFSLYGGALWGVLPTNPGISWEGHLFGFVGGVLAARGLSRRRSPAAA
jgi:membrane associated rhomboid family serine protease